VDTVVLRARKERKRPQAESPARTKGASGRRSRAASRQRLTEVTDRIQAAEGRLSEIDALFCEADYFTATPAAEVRARQAERDDLARELAGLMTEWEALEVETEASEVPDR
jgi:ABC transporter C-terminal domain